MENNEPLVLTLDCGTQSVRALLFDKNGTLLSSSQEHFTPPYTSPKPGWAETDPYMWWDKLSFASIHLKNSVSSTVWNRIEAVSLTTQRDSQLCLGEDKEPLRPAILWLDQRRSENKTPLPFLNRFLFRLVGMTDTVNFTRSRSTCNWLRENESEIWNKTKYYIMTSGWLTYLLTGNLTDAVGSQIGHIPFDYKNRKWMKSGLTKCVTNVEEDKLIELKETGEILGYITKKASERTGIKEGLPLYATGSDKGCETLGCGNIDSSSASLSFGTTSTVELTLDHYVEPERFLPCYQSVIPGYFNPEIEIYRGYWMITWFKKEFAKREEEKAKEEGRSTEDILNDALETIPPGSDGLMLQPYWGPGLKRPEAKGAIIGFSDYHTRAHVYRAIIEGINYGLMEGLETLEKRAHVKVRRLTLSGGGSKSDAICQITSDMFSLPVYRVQTNETSGLGSAIVTYKAMGVYKTYKEAMDSMVHYGEPFIPNEKNSKLYSKLFNNVYKSLYPKLIPLYKEIKDILKGEENE